MSSPKIFTLQQVVSSIRKTIEERYQSEYWVKAEMHKLGRTPSGHCYPELVQKENGKIVAEVRGTIWKFHFETINERFMKVVKEPLKEDTTLLMKVRVSFHEIYGLSLQITDIDPNYSLGELQRERAETLKKLEKDGLINANQKLNFPLLPKRIAVISAESSKGLSDFMKVIEQNEWGYRFFTMLFPAYLQGDQAEHSIKHQLNQIAKVRSHFDIVVIVRGGGGEVGMSCYNNYNLCKAIASFPLPILTGIGHSTNLTVAELISFRNAITPTELGDFLIQAFHEFSIPIKDAMKGIKVHSKQQLERARMLLNHQTKSFSHATNKSLEKEQNGLKILRQDLKHGTKAHSVKMHDTLKQFRHYITSSSRLVLQQNANRIARNSSKIIVGSKTLLVANKNGLERMEYSVRVMDPINVLERGYSITTINGKTIKPENTVKKGDRILTKTANFSIESEVIKSKSNE